jgi:hypothetical protein
MLRLNALLVRLRRHLSLLFATERSFEVFGEIETERTLHVPHFDLCLPVPVDDDFDLLQFHARVWCSVSRQAFGYPAEPFSARGA